MRNARSQFPALARAADFIFFDNAAGAQVPTRVLDAVTDHLVARNVQRGGPYRHSQEVDAMIARTRAGVAAFLNADGPDEIAFGLNATSFIRSISLAIGQSLGPRREVIVSELDHEANVATWRALERFGATVRLWPVRADGRLHTADLDRLLTDRTRIVACTVASNATGSIVDVGDAARRAHAAGAELFLDAVHYAPHGPIDVRAIGCDYLVCSGYKIFAPHMGFAWCRRAAINALPTFREDFIPDVTPDKLEAGTYAYENVAGMDAAIAYLETLADGEGAGGSRAERLRRAMTRIADYEQTLSARLLDAIEGVPGAAVHGVADRARLHERVPTVAFTVDGVASSAIADGLSRAGIGVRFGHMYTPRLLGTLGLLPGGVVRASLVHYNTPEEIDRFADALARIVTAATKQG